MEDIFNDTLRNDAILEKGYGKILIFRLLLDILNFDDQELKEITASNVSLLLALGFWKEVSLFLDYMIRSYDPVQIANWILVMNKAMDSTFFVKLSVSGSVSEHLQPRWCEGLIDTLKMVIIIFNVVFPLHDLYFVDKYPHGSKKSLCSAHVYIDKTPTRS